jgi:O-methyltransferase
VKALNAEPWVDLPNGAGLADWGLEQRIAYNQANRQTEKARFFVNAFDFLTDNRVHGEYWEFGCHRARTFRMALTEARRHLLDDMRFVAFDSFEGLPEPKDRQVVELWKKGALKTSEEDFRAMIAAHGIYTDRVELVKGFYADSLNGELYARFWDTDRRPALVTVDCDLYESACEVFRFIAPFVGAGTVIYIDDFFAGYKGSPLKGVTKALGEFRHTLADHDLLLTEHMQIGWWGRSFIVY